jgi:hypothetical protein
MVRLLLGAVLLLPSVGARAAELSPLEMRIREQFPSVPIESSAHFQAVQSIVGGKSISALRARFEPAAPPTRPGMPGRPPLEAATQALAARDVDAALRVAYPSFYSDPIVAELLGQRVVLRPVGAHGSNVQGAGRRIEPHVPGQ